MEVALLVVVARFPVGVEAELGVEPKVVEVGQAHWQSVQVAPQQALV